MGGEEGGEGFDRVLGVALLQEGEGGVEDDDGDDGGGENRGAADESQQGGGGQQERERMGDLTGEAHPASVARRAG